MQPQIEIVYKDSVTNRNRFHLNKLENATTNNDYKVQLGIELLRMKISENDITETCSIFENPSYLQLTK